MPSSTEGRQQNIAMVNFKQTGCRAKCSIGTEGHCPSHTPALLRLPKCWQRTLFQLQGSTSPFPMPSPGQRGRLHAAHCLKHLTSCSICPATLQGPGQGCSQPDWHRQQKPEQRENRLLLDSLRQQRQAISSAWLVRNLYFCQ